MRDVLYLRRLPLFVVFVSHLGRPAASEAEPLAALLGLTTYEVRLALAAPTPAIVQTTSRRERASDIVALLRSRGHGAHVFDEDNFIPSERMVRMDDFRVDGEGVRRIADGDLLPFGDVFAILRAVHRTRAEIARPSAQVVRGSTAERMKSLFSGSADRVMSKVEDREHVAYFFRRSGERPWILRESHASYAGLGAERGPVAFGNFVRTVERVREASPTGVYDDRLMRRRVVEHMRQDSSLEATFRSSSAGIDLLAHLLAMTIASQGGSPYR